jgi:hypothetical protein
MAQIHRAYLTDAPVSQVRRAVRDATGVTTLKTKICSYYGDGFVAERGDDGALNIFLMSSDPLPNATVVSDGHPMSAAKLQRLYEDRFPRGR